MESYFREAANIVGVVGVFVVLYAYLSLQIGKMRHEKVWYSVLNTAGSIFILYSLFFYWNLASGIIEIAWLVISLYGLGKAIQLRKNGKALVENIH